ncbi:Hypothetical protein SRAE_X000180800, partial [Strongyloides ratti]
METNPRLGDPSGEAVSNEPFQMTERGRKRKILEDINNINHNNDDITPKKKDENLMKMGINKTYAEIVKNNENNINKSNTKVSKANIRFCNLAKKKPISKPPKIMAKSKKVINHLIPEKKDIIHGNSFNLNPNQRWIIFQKQCGRKQKIFRHELRKWTPIEEIDFLLHDKLKDLMKIWDKPKVNHKESMITWRKATKEILIAGMITKSYDSRKFDDEGNRIDNIIKLQKALKRTTTFQKKVRNDLKKKGNKNAEYRIRQIIKKIRKSSKILSKFFILMIKESQNLEKDSK